MTGTQRSALLLALCALLVGCSENAARTGMPLDLPSAGESVFAEKRDLVVAGYFDPPLHAPGDVRIELYLGEDPEGTPVRRIESHVDPATGVTPRESLDFSYANGQAWGPSGAVTDPAEIVMTPDLVAVPGGIESPTNKVVVTKEYYAGVILGGVTRTFDTTYADEDGLPLADLNAGTYTILVTGLSGELEGRTGTKRIEFGRTHAMLGRFSPDYHREEMLAYASQHGYRTYIDFFPGFFSHDGYAYEVAGRWMANNSVEVANTFPDSLVDTVASAANDVVLYNISDTSATQLIEIGAITANGLLTEQTTFHYYDVGEPFLTYTDASTGSQQMLDGTIVTFADGDRLALTRAESRRLDGLDKENLYDVGDATPITIDTDLADGVEIDASCELSIYGVVVPIPSATRPGPLPHQYEIDNAIRTLHYAIRDGSGATVVSEEHAVGLDRRFEPVDAPDRIASSIYEFRHEFHLGSAGTYAVSVIGRDADGLDVPGSEAAFTLTVAALR